MSPLPVAFYAPLKSPHHSRPSGDRTMGRLLMAALARAGLAPRLASELRTYEPAGDPARQQVLCAASAAEAERLIAAFQAGPAAEKPRLWFTYHPYYKAPDWLGPIVATRLGIPYAVAEASRADKRADGPWAEAHRAVESALAQASLVLALTPQDRDALERRRPSQQRIVDLPPFIDADAFGARPDRGPPSSPVRLLCVAMMRPGDKLRSYALLAESLGLLPDTGWHLDIVGDGPARAEIEALFAPFGAIVRFQGAIEDRLRLGRLYAGADLLVWPAVNEAYGMVLLEAQAMGCPVLAGGFGGVASALQAGVTGEIARPGDATAFAVSLWGLLADPDRRTAMSAAAIRFIREERSLDSAARILRHALVSLFPELAAA